MNERQKSPPSPTSNDLTVVLFRDQLPSRSVTFPVSWISWFGITLTVILLTVTLAVFFSFRSFFRTLPLDRTSHTTAEITAGPAPTVTVTATVTVGPDAQALPAVAPAPISQPITPPVSTTTGISLFPNEASLVPSSTALAIQNFKTLWTGGGGSWRKLTVKFDIAFKSPDGTPQNGNILVLARGPETLVAYPSETIQKSGAFLIDPSKGETFSVTRLRVVNAEYNQGGFSAKSLTQIEVWLFDSNQKLLLHQDFPIAQPKAEKTVTPATNKPASPAVESTGPANPKAPQAVKPADTAQPPAPPSVNEAPAPAAPNAPTAPAPGGTPQ